MGPQSGQGLPDDIQERSHRLKNQEHARGQFGAPSISGRVLRPPNPLQLDTRTDRRWFPELSPSV